MSDILTKDIKAHKEEFEEAMCHVLSNNESCPCKRMSCKECFELALNTLLNYQKTLVKYH